MKLLRAFVLAACAWNADSLLAQVDVPGDFAILQDAIDAVAPGTVILVHGGTHDSIVIDKPLTIVGESSPLIKAQFVFSTFTLQASVTLAGPGSGDVVLIGLRTSGTLQEGLVGFGEPGIVGSGFDQLRVLHCTIEGCSGDSSSSEVLQGTHGIDVTVPYLVIEDSIVRGGDTEHSLGGPGPPVGSIGILAPFSTVTLLDSEVTGGLVFDVLWHEFFEPCPPGCAQIPGGAGGTGIVAAQLIQSDSKILGGAGATFTCDAGGFICAKPDGAALLVPLVTTLPNSLSASGPLDEGTGFDLSWFSLGNPALLLASTVPTPPVVAGSHGLLFLDVDGALVLSVPGGGLQSASFTVPVNTAVIGIDLTLQIYDPVLGLTRPVLAGFVP